MPSGGRNGRAAQILLALEGTARARASLAPTVTRRRARYRPPLYLDSAFYRRSNAVTALAADGRNPAIWCVEGNLSRAPRSGGRNLALVERQWGQGANFARRRRGNWRRKRSASAGLGSRDRRVEDARRSALATCRASAAVRAAVLREST